jgi:hypothetical protein
VEEKEVKNGFQTGKKRLGTCRKTDGFLRNTMDDRKHINDNLEATLRRKLHDLEIEVGADDWAMITAGMGARQTRVAPWVRYVLVAASVAVVATFGFHLMRDTRIDVLDNPIQLVEQQATPSPLPIIREVTPAMEAVAKLQDAVLRSGQSGPVRLINVVQDATRVENALSAASTPEVAGNGTPTGQPSYGQNLPDRDQQNYGSTGNNNRSVGNFNDPFANVRTSRKKDNSSLAMFANSSIIGNNASGTNLPNMVMTAWNMDALKNGSKSSMAIDPGDVSWKHYIPLSVGVTFRKDISADGRFGIESGLVYSYLSSKAELEGTTRIKLHQQLHYLGIPVSATYALVKNPTYEVYLRGGIQADLNISARETKDYIYSSVQPDHSEPRSLDAKGLQMSLSASAGVMYNLSPRVGLYLEPGFGYYFENGNHPESYWQDHPANFNVRLGVRTTF